MSELRIEALLVRAKDSWLRRVHYVYVCMYLAYIGLGVVNRFWLHDSLNLEHWSLDTATIVIATVGLVYAGFFEWFAQRNLVLAGFLSQFLASIFAAYLIEASHGANMVYQITWLVVLFASSVFGLLVLIGETLIGTMVASFTLAGIIPHPTVSMTTEIILTIAGIIVPLIGWIVLRRSLHQTIDPLAGEAKVLVTMLDEEKIKSGVVLDSISDGVIVLNAAKTVLLVNSGAQQITQWRHNPSTPAGSINEILVSVPDPTQPIGDVPGTWLDRAIDEVLTGKSATITNPNFVITAADTEIFLNIAINPVKVDSAIAGIVISFQDATKERRLEQDRINFIATSSHEMRTPVAEIEAALSLLTMNQSFKTADQKAFGILERAHQSILHLGDLTNDMMLVSEIDANVLDTTVEDVDVVTVIKELVQRVAPDAEAKGITIEQRAEAAIALVIVMNRHYFDVVYKNLLDNAVKFTNEHGRIIVSMSQVSGAVVIDVANEGVEIPAEAVPKLFRKYGRLESHLTRQLNGTGLGLYIVKSLIEFAHGTVEYKRRDNMTVLSCSLPLNTKTPHNSAS